MNIKIDLTKKQVNYITRKLKADIDKTTGEHQLVFLLEFEEHLNEVKEWHGV